MIEFKKHEFTQVMSQYTDHYMIYSCFVNDETRVLILEGEILRYDTYEINSEV